MCFGTSSGKLSQLLHFGPAIAIFLITYITTAGLYCLLQWWPPYTWDGQLNLAIYITWPIVIFYNYFNAVFLGPGFVPKGWRPDNPDNERKLQYCKLCDSFKAPRSHHCRKCNRCVLKMDHHCPWINTCCGHKNHSAFTYFLLYAPIGCVHATMVLSISIYRAIFRNYYIYYNTQDVPLVHLTLTGLIVCMFAVGMAIGVTIAVGILFCIQMKSVSTNQTGIEDWIVKKAHHRRQQQFSPDGKQLTSIVIDEKFIYPYNLGRKQNARQVFNWTGNWRPVGDGISWQIRPECDQYALTMEQLAQKAEKKTQAVKYEATRDYSGACCPCCSQSVVVSCCVPLNDEARVAIKPGDVIMVTRWQKHWLYGEIVIEEKEEQKDYDEPKTTNVSKNNKKTKKDKSNKKGWFPSKCVRLHSSQSLDDLTEDEKFQILNDYDNNNSSSSSKNKKKTN